MEKQIFTKTQAVLALTQIKGGKKIYLFEFVDPKHSLFSQSCEELEKKLLKHLGPSQVSCVVDDSEPNVK
jgi:hypothetical protein